MEGFGEGGWVGFNVKGMGDGCNRWLPDGEGMVEVGKMMRVEGEEMGITRLRKNETG